MIRAPGGTGRTTNRERTMTATKLAARETVRPNQPLAYRVNEFCRVVGLGRTTVYALIAEGKLATIKIGNRRLIPHEAAVALLAEAGK
jgi:excisionase family DNA binding protein